MVYRGVSRLLKSLGNSFVVLCIFPCYPRQHELLGSSIDLLGPFLLVLSARDPVCCSDIEEFEVVV